MRIEIPELSVVALIGASGSGKSTFAAKHFKPTEVLSSDYFRALVSDNPYDQSATNAAFDALYTIAGKRLDGGKLTVIDATNVQKKSREQIINIAKGQHCLATAIVLNTSSKICEERNIQRQAGQVGRHVIRNQSLELKKSIRNLKREGFRYVYVLETEEDVENAEIVRTKLWTNKKEETGPFDIIGDVHGCFDELQELLLKLGYTPEGNLMIPPSGRKVIFLGDLTDRGPKNTEVLRLVMDMVEEGHAYCLPGNHDVKLQRFLRGANVQQAHGIDITIGQLEEESEEFRARTERFIDSLVSHYVLDGGRLVVAHAGLKEQYQGRSSGKVREFCLYGDTTGQLDEDNLPVRLNWAEEYRGKAFVVYGHIAGQEATFLNNTVCIDTGCVFGGRLTAFRYPEKEIVSVAAGEVYCQPVRPLSALEREYGDVLDIGDVSGKRHLRTSLLSSIIIQEENGAAALEIMSRFAADPHWLIYLPPTMSPCETSPLDNVLEHPLEAFDYYKRNGMSKVICQQKHMGSRAVIVLCKDQEAAQRSFGVSDGSEGIIYTRTGRHFFENRSIQNQLLDKLRFVLRKTHFWEDFQTDWVCLDAELLPWSAKAQALLETQYSAVGRAGREGLAQSVEALRWAVNRQLTDYNIEGASGQTVNLQEVLSEFEERQVALDLYTKAYGQYCWDVVDIDDYKIAPFHILAAEGMVFGQKEHLWHMENIKKYMTGIDPIFMATDYIAVDLNDEKSIQKGVTWWETLTGSGGEGMVVKPQTFIAYKQNELLQPAVKCRGREYLRIIYGPEYTREDHMSRLKKRSLSKKRSLALREFALGMESLERFVAKEPLYRVHECVFGVLALESEPVDPRL